MVVGLPDVRGRIEILKHHMADVQADVEVDPSIIARGCPGMSGADLQNLVNQVSKLFHYDFVAHGRPLSRLLERDLPVSDCITLSGQKVSL